MLERLGGRGETAVSHPNPFTIRTNQIISQLTGLGVCSHSGASTHAAALLSASLRSQLHTIVTSTTCPTPSTVRVLLGALQLTRDTHLSGDTASITSLSASAAARMWTTVQPLLHVDGAASLVGRLLGLVRGRSGGDAGAAAAAAHTTVNELLDEVRGQRPPFDRQVAGGFFKPGGG